MLRPTGKWVRVLLRLSSLLTALSISAGHLTTRSCGLFGGGASSNQSVLLEYRWETALEPQHLQQNFTTEHEQEWAQLNHICSAKQTALISRVRLVVDAAHARSCHPNSNNTTDNLLATTWDDTTWNDASIYW